MFIDDTSRAAYALSSIPAPSGNIAYGMVREISSICNTVFYPLTLALSQTALPSSPKTLVSNVLTNTANMSHHLLKTGSLGCAAFAVGALGMIAALLQQKISGDEHSVPAQEHPLFALMPDEAWHFAASIVNESIPRQLSSDIPAPQLLWSSDNNHAPATYDRAEDADAVPGPGNTLAEGEQTTWSEHFSSALTYVLTYVDEALSGPLANMESRLGADARALPQGGNGTMTFFGAPLHHDNSDSTHVIDKRWIWWYARDSDCNLYAIPREKVQRTKDCYDHFDSEKEKTDYLFDFMSSQGRRLCEKINQQIENTSVLTGKPRSTGVSSECFEENISEDLNNIRDELNGTLKFIELIDNREDNVTKVSVEILRIHKNDMIVFQQKLIEQKKKILDINNSIRHPPEHCSKYAPQYYVGETSRDMIENLKQFACEDRKRRFVINRDIILGNNDIPSASEIGCESRPIAQRNMNEFANEFLLQCQGNIVKKPFCEEEKTQQARQIFQGRFFAANFRRPFSI